MRVAILSLLASAAVVGSAVVTAGCSSKSSAGEQPDSAGDDAGAGGCAQFTDDAGLTTPTVSFKNDVFPIFQFSCGISSSCHGGDPSMDIAARGLFLGCSSASIDAGTCMATGDEVSQVYAGLVGTAANTPIEETCMPFVMAGDPTMSYLMHKMDGDQCIVTCCKEGNAAVMAAEGMAPWCGQFMPYQVMVLPAGPVCGGSTDCSQPGAFARDTIRAWIAQGAMNN
ncbi:MAG: hypothetical protein ACLP1X_09935 [Polyangiaceae bacterium]